MQFLRVSLETSQRILLRAALKNVRQSVLRPRDSRPLVDFLNFGGLFKIVSEAEAFSRRRVEGMWIIIRVRAGRQNASGPECRCAVALVSESRAIAVTCAKHALKEKKKNNNKKQFA